MESFHWSWCWSEPLKKKKNESWGGKNHEASHRSKRGGRGGKLCFIFSKLSCELFFFFLLPELWDSQDTSHCWSYGQRNNREQRASEKMLTKKWMILHVQRKRAREKFERESQDSSLLLNWASWWVDPPEILKWEAENTSRTVRKKTDPKGPRLNF